MCSTCRVFSGGQVRLSGWRGHESLTFRKRFTVQVFLNLIQNDPTLSYTTPPSCPIYPARSAISTWSNTNRTWEQEVRDGCGSKRVTDTEEEGGRPGWGVQSPGKKTKEWKPELRQNKRPDRVGAGQEALPATSSPTLHCISCNYFTGSSRWKKMWADVSVFGRESEVWDEKRE